MTTTISKGKLFRCTVVVNDEMVQAMKECKGNAEDALQAGADYWHTGILPKHFVAGAGGVYGYAPRSPNYRKQQRGKPPLVFSGSLRRELLGRASVQRVGSSVNLKMTARVLNLAPTMPQNSDDLYVKHKSGHGYPNLKREIKAITDDEKESVAGVVAKDLERSFRPTERSKGFIVDSAFITGA